RVLEGSVQEKRQILGFAEYQQVLDQAELLAIAIDPAMQGRGLGSWLLKELLLELRRQGCRRCLLEVRRSNARARRLYGSAGFREDGCRRAYYPPAEPGAQAEDALLYSCELSDSDQ